MPERTDSDPLGLDGKLYWPNRFNVGSTWRGRTIYYIDFAGGSGQPASDVAVVAVSTVTFRPAAFDTVPRRRD